MRSKKPVTSCHAAVAYLAICLPDTAIHRRDSPIFTKMRGVRQGGLRLSISHAAFAFKLSSLVILPGGRRDLADKLLYNEIVPDITICQSYCTIPVNLESLLKKDIFFLEI